MKRVAYIVVALAIGSCCFVSDLPASEKSSLDRTIDSLFVIASSGEVRFRDQNGPAMDSIATYGVRAVPWLIDKFTTKSARERWTVLWTLQRIGSDAVPDLIVALKRPEWLVVQRVCWALGDIKDSAAVEPLIVMFEHENWHVRDQVATALGKIRHSQAEPTITAAFQDSIGQVRKAAAVSSAQLGMNGVVEMLVHQLGDEFYGARMTAAEALVQLDTAMVVGCLKDSIESSNRFVGDIGCRLLGQLMTETAEAVLLSQAKHSDPERRAHAAIALIKSDPDDHCNYRENLLLNETDRLTHLKIESMIQQSEQ